MYRILIAEDEQLEREALEQALGRAFGSRCEVRTAINGQQAVDIAKVYAPQIILMDIEMPVMNGLEAARQIRSLYPRCKFLLLTAYGTFQYARQAISIGVEDYLLKPIADKQLVEAVEQAIARLDTLPTPIQRSDEADVELADVRLHQIKREIERYIESNYARDLSIGQTAADMHYSEAYFSKLFKRCFQTSFVSYLTDVRIRMARRLLEDPLVNIKHVGAKVGFSDANYFAKVFRKQLGVSPSQYQRGERATGGQDE